MLTQAATASVRSHLRFQDWLCLLLAEKERWTCITNDKRLRTECETRSVAVMWGLQLLIRLVQYGALDADGAIQLAHDMHAVNRRIPKDVVARFVRKVRTFR
jgi:hypothetical protein